MQHFYPLQSASARLFLFLRLAQTDGPHPLGRLRAFLVYILLRLHFIVNSFYRLV
jgi:hypothetical protein